MGVSADGGFGLECVDLDVVAEGLMQEQQMRTWAVQFLPDALPLADSDFTALTGDAGFRRYFRVHTRPARIAVWAPPEHEDTPAFVAKGQALAAAGVHVPRVIAVDYRHGFMLQEDLGQRLYLDELNPTSVDALYGRAIDTLLAIQETSRDPDIFPSYDDALLRRELALFPEWFIGGLLGIELSGSDQEVFTAVSDLLVANALAQPQVVVHRDYHARNLLVLPAGAVGVVDYQDAVIGPLTYDLVSLLKDCYVRWPPALVRRHALAYATCARERGLLMDVNDADFLIWFDLMGLQRHLKVLGIFARLWLRDGKNRYLADLPLVLRYTIEAASGYAQTQPLRQWLEARVLPHLPGQSWYNDWRTAGEREPG